VKLFRDPHLAWDNPFPYEALSSALVSRGCAPVTPDSTIAEIKAAFFDVMDAQSDPVVRHAWDELRIPTTRLAVDFFLYPCSDDHDAFDGLSAVELPAYLPDFRELAHVEMEPPPEPPIIREPPPLDIGPVSVDLHTWTGDDDE
jgi:hypothetical protein